MSGRTIRDWTKDARAEEKHAQQELAWDMWLDCHTQEAIAERVGVTQPAIVGWLSKMADLPKFIEPPASRQHFDVWVTCSP